jgi:transposase
MKMMQHRQVRYRRDPALQAFRGIGFLSAVTIVAEAGDLRRFATAHGSWPTSGRSRRRIPVAATTTAGGSPRPGTACCGTSSAKPPTTRTGTPAGVRASL